MRHKEAVLLARRALYYQLDSTDKFISAETISDEEGWREVFTYQEKSGEVYTIEIDRYGGETYKTKRMKFLNKG